MISITYSQRAWRSDSMPLGFPLAPEYSVRCWGVSSSSPLISPPLELCIRMRLFYLFYLLFFYFQWILIRLIPGMGRLGNIFCLASIMFLVGPGYQVRNMFRNYRAVATLVYLSTLVLTLFAALYVRVHLPPNFASTHAMNSHSNASLAQLHNAILVLLSVIVQSLAMIW